METIISNTLFQIPAKYLKNDFAWKTKPTFLGEIDKEEAVFYSVTKKGSILRVPKKELIPVQLPYFNYHLDNSRIIIVDSTLISGKTIYNAAFEALKSIGKYSDGGSMSCRFTDNTLTKVRVKGENGTKTFTIEELNKY